MSVCLKLYNSNVIWLIPLKILQLVCFGEGILLGRKNPEIIKKSSENEKSGNRERKTQKTKNRGHFWIREIGQFWTRISYVHSLSIVRKKFSYWKISKKSENPRKSDNSGNLITLENRNGKPKNRVIPHFNKTQKIRKYVLHRPSKGWWWNFSELLCVSPQRFLN